MGESNQKKSLQVSLSFFLTGALATASTLITLEKYKAAIISVLVGGACTLIVGIVIKIVRWLHPEDE